jgi:hypothetical protein
MRRLGHAFLPAGHHHRRIAGGDLLGGERHGAQARAAELVDAEGCALGRDAGGHRRLPGRVLPGAAVRIWPMMTSSTSDGFTPARSSAATMATRPSSWAGTLAKAPLKLPTGVRAIEAMTISVMCWGSLNSLRAVLRAPGAGATTASPG